MPSQEPGSASAAPSPPRPSRRQALLFRDLLDLCNFLRVCGSNARSKSGYTLYQFRDPEDRNAFLYAMLGFTPRADLPYLLRKTTLQEDPDGITELTPAGEPNRKLRVLAKRQSERLLDFASLRPWEAPPTPLAHLLFVLTNPELLTKLSYDCLRLDNDRISFASVAPQGGVATGSQTRLLVRVEDPSYFLAQKYSEDFPDDVALYWRVAPDTYLPFGMTHPLADLLQRSHSQRPPHLVLWNADGSTQLCERPEWTDLYDAARFDFAFDQAPQWTWVRRPPSQPALSIPLMLRPGKRTEPELWLLPQDARPRLEALLARTEQAELDAVSLALYRDSREEEVFLLRRTSEKSQAIFEALAELGSSFSTVGPLRNLYLPVNTELFPRVRPEFLRTVFQLERGTATIVAPVPSHDRLIVLRFRDSDFLPVTSLVEYLLQVHEEQLAPLLQGTTFSFRHWENAPSAESLRPVSAPRSSPVPNAPSEIQNAPQEAPPRPAPKPPMPPRTDDDDLPAEEAKNALEREEEAAEHRLVEEGQSLSAWSRLVEIKDLLRKPLQVAECYPHLVFRCATPDDEHSALSQWHAYLTRHQDELTIDALATEQADIFLKAFHARTLPPEDIDNWLLEVLPKLHQVEARLPLKLRWILWKEVARQSRNDLLLMDVRDRILHELIETGIAPESIPSFTKAAINRIRHISHDESGTNNEYSVATRCLNEIVKSKLATIEHVAPALFAATAYAFRRSLGDEVNASEFFRRARSSTKDPTLLRLVETYEYYSLGRKGEALDLLTQASAKSLGNKSDSEVRELNEFTRNLHQQSESEDTSTFLSSQNIQRLHNISAQGNKNRESGEPASSGHKAAFGAVDPQTILTSIRSIEQSTDPVETARRLAELQDALLLAKKTQDLGQIVSAVRKLAARLASSRMPESIYSLLRDIYLSHAFIVLQLHQEAQAISVRCLERVGRLSVSLDFIDGISVLLQSCQHYPLSMRYDLLSRTTNQIVANLQRNAPQYARSRLIYWQLLRLIDQLVHASVGKEALAIEVYRSYLIEDERQVFQVVSRHTAHP